MAIAPKITFSANDGDNDPANTSIHVPTGFTLAQYATFAQDYADAIDNVTLGIIGNKATMQFPVDISGLTGNVVSVNSDVERIAAFQFLDTNGEPVDVNVPGLNTSDILSGTDSLNTADTQIAAFITLMETGNGTIAPSSVAEADIIDTIYARAETKASGRKRR